MEWLWMSLLLVASCTSTVQGSREVDVKEASINTSQPLHILVEHNLLVLTPAGLTHRLNQTRFLMVLFYIPSSKQSRNMAEELGKAAEIMGKGKNGVGFGKVDITIEKELQKEFDIKKTPDLKLFFEGNRSEPISCKGNCTWASVKKHQSSDEIPKFWDQGPVKQLVGKNFNVVVFDKERDVFVMFYAPWSQKCRALLPVLEELGRKYQNHSTVSIAKIDITANDIQLMKLDWYPFFRLFPTDSQKVVPYKGEYTMKGFSDFLESQIKTRIEDEDELLSIEQSAVIEEEVLAEEEEVPFMEKELPEQKLTELENGTKPEYPAGQKEIAEKERKVAKPKGPPRQEKKPRVKEEL
nr:protein disulfide-isomerase-like protein of the testis [Equus caballus]